MVRDQAALNTAFNVLLSRENRPMTSRERREISNIGSSLNSQRISSTLLASSGRALTQPQREGILDTLVQNGIWVNEPEQEAIPTTSPRLSASTYLPQASAPERDVPEGLDEFLSRVLMPLCRFSPEERGFDLTKTNGINLILKSKIATNNMVIISKMADVTLAALEFAAEKSEDVGSKKGMKDIFTKALCDCFVNNANQGAIISKMKESLSEAITANTSAEGNIAPNAKKKRDNQKVAVCAIV